MRYKVQAINFTYGSLGVDNSPGNALKNSVNEWFMVFGSVLLNCLSESQKHVKIDTFRIYSGYLCIKGAQPGGWVNGSDEMLKTIIKPLKNLIKEDTIRPLILDLKLHIPASGNIDGECRVNARISPVLLSRVKNFHDQR